MDLREVLWGENIAITLCTNWLKLYHWIFAFFSQVVDELKSLESEAAYDYLKVENEMRELDTEIDRSDSILAELEGVLENFRDHLNEIKS
jgi:hypothetical protein